MPEDFETSRIAYQAVFFFVLNMLINRYFVMNISPSVFGPQWQEMVQHARMV